LRIRGEPSALCQTIQDGPVTETKVFIFTVVAVGLMLVYVYWQNRVHSGAWMPEAARAQLQRERRVPTRINCVTDVSVIVGNYTVHATSVNIAVGGVLLKPSSPLFVGQPVHLKLDLPDGPRIEIPGVVCRKQGEHVAVKFDVITEKRALIQQWVDKSER
jgi:PilZ domain